MTQVKFREGAAEGGAARILALPGACLLRCTNCFSIARPLRICCRSARRISGAYCVTRTIGACTCPPRTARSSSRNTPTVGCIITGTSSYVTLDDLAQMIRRDEEFTVHDAKSGDDITHPVLTQNHLRAREQGRPERCCPFPSCGSSSSFYGDQMQMVVPSFLETVDGRLRQGTGALPRSDSSRPWSRRRWT